MNENCSSRQSPRVDLRHRAAALCALVGLTVVLQLQAASVRAERRVSEEAAVFKRVRAGVFTIFGERGRGSGFLVDSLGIVLTNDHVVGNSDRIRVMLDDTTRVEAVLLATDPKRDVAAVWVAPSAVAGRPVLKLATPSDSMVVEGEKVIAVGSPLHQEAAMTSGIVSRVQPTAVISDVNLNHGNSGGPLLNLDAEVVAINTFGDIPDQGGPGISGSVNIAEALEVLRIAHINLKTSPAPSARRLPVASRTPFPIDSLQAAASFERFDASPYDVSSNASTGKFEVTLSTPIYQAWRENRFDVEMAKRVRDREQRGNGSVANAYDPLREMRDWMRYTGNDYVPVVTLQVTPQTGEKGSSIFGNIMGSALLGSAYRPTHVLAFKSDFKDVHMLRDSVEVDDLGRARVLVPLAFARSTWSADYVGQDLARVGIMQCAPETFRPSAGRPPHIVVSIISVEHPEKPVSFELPAATVKRVWEDFVVYRRLTGTFVDSLEYASSASRDRNHAR